jgi:hypothetical protein
MQMYLHIVQEDELPSIQVCTNSNIHILHGCPLKPASRFFQSLDPPNSSSSIEPKEVQEDPIDLLLHFKVEAKVDILKAGQEALILCEQG